MHAPAPADLDLVHAVYCETAPPTVLLHSSLRTGLLQWLMLGDDSTLLTQPDRRAWKRAVDVLCALLQLPGRHWKEAEAMGGHGFSCVHDDVQPWCVASALDAHAEWALQANIPGALTGVACVCVFGGG